LLLFFFTSFLLYFFSSPPMPLDDSLPSGIPRSAWFVVGATASGKTAVGIELAKRLSGEIISLDSMALYRGLDIGTAKPTVAEQAAAPHHLIDLLAPSEEFSVAEYLRAARDAANAIELRGLAAIFVGGTPLYLKALLRGMFEGPPADWEFRRAWEARAAEHAPEWLHAQLAAVDAAAAAKLHANDARRIIRALEVLEKTGTPMSAWQQQFDRPQSRETCRVYVLHWQRETLYRRINERVVAMFDAGLVAEVESLLASGATFGRTAAQALGYREVLEHLRGEHDLATTIELVQNRTRAFARRQLTWFRSLEECRWVELGDGGDPQEWATRIASGYCD
jgi:tRNA dimethylallyltransferase